jgi:hypothetical protein
MERVSVCTTQASCTGNAVNPTCERATELYRVLNTHQMELERQDMDRYLLRTIIKEEKSIANAEIEEFQQRQWKAYHTSNKEFACQDRSPGELKESRSNSSDLTTVPSTGI